MIGVSLLYVVEFVFRSILNHCGRFIPNDGGDKSRKEDDKKEQCLSRIGTQGLPDIDMCKEYKQFTTSLIPSGDSTCCNGILGFAGNRRFMPCSEMRCCNQSETVALERVNHAVGFCFRCVALDYFNSKCYSSGQEVATTNNTDVLYELRTCCQGLKFKVILHSNDVAMVIKCVRR